MEFKNLIEARRSVRKYIASEISEAEVEVIVGEAQNAPSWKNTEVTRYYAAVSAEAKGRLWDEVLPSFNVARTAVKPLCCSHFATQSSLRSADIRKPVGEVVKVL